MSKYAVLFDEHCKKQINKLDNSTKQRISKILDKLETTPKEVGKPLRYAGGKLWEARIGKYRMYYTIAENVIEILSLVLVLDISHKDEQIKTINNLSVVLKEKLQKAISKLKTQLRTS